MDEFIRLVSKYSDALNKTLSANNKLREVLVQVAAGRELLRKELGADRTQCEICCERPKTRTLNCGHLFCSSCTSRILTDPPQRCPTCRAPAHRSIRVYINA
jgi:hypothetical protein